MIQANSIPHLLERQGLATVKQIALHAMTNSKDYRRSTHYMLSRPIRSKGMIPLFTCIPPPYDKD